MDKTSAKAALTYYAELALTFYKLDKSKYAYTIQENEHYKETYKDDEIGLQKVYWEEILQRAHWAGLSSLLRNLKWVEGVNQAIKDNNLLSFTSNLRCLIESCGDILHSLLSVPSSLADNFDGISGALEGRERKDKSLFASPELEEILIHFAYGRKISKEEKKLEEKLPNYHNAKPAAEYLKHLDNKENGPISELYAFLCEFAHPAARSVHYLFDEIRPGSKEYKFTYSQNPDEKYIQIIFDVYNDEIIKSIILGFNPSLLTLKTLNFFNYELTKTPILDEINLDDISIWKTISGKLKK